MHIFTHFLSCDYFCPQLTVFVAGLPRARSARGTEPHTHRLWSTSFRLVVTWLTERTYVRTYASTDCTGGVGETINRKGGVSQACRAKSTSFTLDIHNMVNWQLSNQDSHWPVSHDHVAGSCVNSLRWRDLFGSCPLTSNCFTRSRTQVSSSGSPRIFGGKLRWRLKKKFSVHCLFETQYYYSTLLTFY